MGRVRAEWVEGHLRMGEHRLDQLDGREVGDSRGRDCWYGLGP